MNPKHNYTLLWLVIGILYIITAVSTWFSFGMASSLSKEISGVYLLGIVITVVSSIYLVSKGEPLKWFLERLTKFFVVSIVVTFVVLIPLGLLYGGEQYLENVLVEAHGLLFDLLVFGVLLSWYDNMKKQDENRKRKEKERNLRIEQHQEQIDYHKHRKSDDTKSIIRKHIQGLNKEGATKVNMSRIDISGTQGERQLIIENLELDGSRLFRSNLSYLTLPKN